MYVLEVQIPTINEDGIINKLFYFENEPSKNEAIEKLEILLGIYKSQEKFFDVDLTTSAFDLIHIVDKWPILGSNGLFRVEFVELTNGSKAAISLEKILTVEFQIKKWGRSENPK